jgi:hypothetical protein
MDSTTSPKMKTMEKGVEARPMAHNTLGVEGMLELQDGG